MLLQSALKGGGGWEGARGRVGRVGPGGVGSNLVPTSSDGDRRRRPEIELLKATWRRRRRGPAARLLTVTEVQPSKRKSQILDQRLEAGSTATD